MFNSTAVKIALFISIICTILLVTLNVLVNIRTQDTIRNVTIVRQIDKDGNVTFIPIEQELQMPAGVRNLVDAERGRLNDYLNIATLLAVLVSVILGFAAARFITNPLHQLNIGLMKLRQSNYKINLKPVGTKEFDDVVDEFNKLVTELDRTENLRKDLISDASHELKTPITSLIGQLQGAKDGVIKLDDAKINLLLAQALRLDELVSGLQDYTRLRSKTINLNIEEIELKSFVQEVINEFSDRFEKSDIRPELNIGENFKTNADKSLLKGVLTNLFDNAIKYSKGDTLSIFSDEKSLSIKDNGVGIPNKKIKYIFERFYRVDESRNRESGGMGLGLAIVKEMVESLGWSIEARNTNPGLEFIINFESLDYVISN